MSRLNDDLNIDKEDEKIKRILEDTHTEYMNIVSSVPTTSRKSKRLLIIVVILLGFTIIASIFTSFNNSNKIDKIEDTKEIHIQFDGNNYSINKED